MARPSRLQREVGIVLARRDHGEADRVIVLLTPEQRIDVLAKGVRKTRSRKAGHLELFSKTEVLLSRVKQSWDIVSQAEAVTVRAQLQDDFSRATYARYVAELVIRFFEGETSRQLYDLVDATFERLETAAPAALLTRWFEQQLLALAGFRPEWGMCVGERDAELCREPLRPRPTDRRAYGIDAERGGALCSDCLARHRNERGVRALSPSALSWLQALQQRDYAEAASFDLPPATARELAQVMDRYIAHHLERRPSALRILDG